MMIHDDLPPTHTRGRTDTHTHTLISTHTHTPKKHTRSPQKPGIWVASTMTTGANSIHCIGFSAGWPGLAGWRHRGTCNGCAGSCLWGNAAPPSHRDWSSAAWIHVNMGASPWKSDKGTLLLPWRESSRCLNWESAKQLEKDPVFLWMVATCWISPIQILKTFNSRGYIICGDSAAPGRPRQVANCSAMPFVAPRRCALVVANDVDRGRSSKPTLAFRLTGFWLIFWHDLWLVRNIPQIPPTMKGQQSLSGTLWVFSNVLEPRFA